MEAINEAIKEEGGDCRSVFLSHLERRPITINPNGEQAFKVFLKSPFCPNLPACYTTILRRTSSGLRPVLNVFGAQATVSKQVVNGFFVVGADFAFKGKITRSTRYVWDGRNYRLTREEMQAAGSAQQASW